MAGLFQVARDGEIIGQYSEPEFQRKIFSSEIQPDDFFWREGFPDWKPVSAYRAAAKTQPIFNVGGASVPRPNTGGTSFVSSQNRFQPIASIRRWGARNVSASSSIKREKRESTPASIGGLCAIAAAFAPLLDQTLFFLISLPLLFAAFVLAIVSIARGKIGGGILLLIGLAFAFVCSIAALTDRDKILHHPEAIAHPDRR